MAAAVYHLFDGALLASQIDASSAKADGRLIGLFETSGPQAALAGPLLWLDAKVLPTALTSQSNATDRAWRYGHSRVQTQATFSELHRHLLALERLQVNGMSFYLRYSDSRALRALWASLSPYDQDAFLGPIDLWLATDESGDEFCLRRSTVREATRWRHTLSKAAAECLEAEMVPWQILVAAEAIDDELTQFGSDAWLLETVRRAMRLIGTTNFDARLAASVTVCLARTQSQSEYEPGLCQAIEQARRESNPSLLHDWLARQEIA